MVIEKSQETLKENDIDQETFERAVEQHNDKEISQAIHSLRSFDFPLSESISLLAKLDISKSLALEIIDFYLDQHRIVRVQDPGNQDSTLLMAVIEDRIFDKFNV